MAVNTQPKFAKDFWPYFNRLVATVIVVAQLVILAIISWAILGRSKMKLDVSWRLSTTHRGFKVISLTALG